MKLFTAYIECEAGHISQHPTYEAAIKEIADWCNDMAGSTMYGTPQEIVDAYFGSNDAYNGPDGYTWTIYEFDLVKTHGHDVAMKPDLRFTVDGCLVTAGDLAEVDHPWRRGDECRQGPNPWAAS